MQHLNSEMMHHLNKIKVLLKRHRALNYLNACMKSYMQEREIIKSRRHYLVEARQRCLSVPGKNELEIALRERIESRGIYPVPKTKDTLHIFLAFGLHNWESVLPLALAPFGRVTTFSWQAGSIPDSYKNRFNWRASLNAEMLEVFNKAYSEQPIDAMVGYLTAFTTMKDTLFEIGKRGVVIFNMCWDDKICFSRSSVKGQPRGIKEIVSAVDLNLTNAPDSCSRYTVEGGLSMFWPEAAAPEIHKPYNLPFDFDISFVGGKYGWRPDFMERLRKMGIEVVCFGKGWDNGPLLDEEMVKVYSRSRINLGFGGIGYSKKFMCLKGRDFEVPMSGGLYLTQDNPELSLVYNVGKEIITYKNEKDCAEKIRWLLANPYEAAKIRRAGRERALKEHTWEKRFSEIFHLAGILK